MRNRPTKDQIKRLEKHIQKTMAAMFKSGALNPLTQPIRECLKRSNSTDSTYYLDLSSIWVKSRGTRRKILRKKPLCSFIAGWSRQIANPEVLGSSHAERVRRLKDAKSSRKWIRLLKYTKPQFSFTLAFPRVP